MQPAPDHDHGRRASSGRSSASFSKSMSVITFPVLSHLKRCLHGPTLSRGSACGELVPSLLGLNLTLTLSNPSRSTSKEAPRRWRPRDTRWHLESDKTLKSSTTVGSLGENRGGLITLNSYWDKRPSLFHLEWRPRSARGKLMHFEELLCLRIEVTHPVPQSEL